jgi:tRNA modification GTPase
MHVEACIDFPEEEIDPVDRAQQAGKRLRLVEDLEGLLADAQQGAVLREGLTVVLVGRPNVGKSSLLNRLAGDEVAIVTPVAGTTRDPVRATISIEGVPVHLIDTAGLRDTLDEVERIGVARSWDAIGKAGAVLFIEEAQGGDRSVEADLIARLPRDVPRTRVLNKIDLTPGGSRPNGDPGTLRVSAKTGEGMPGLKAWLLEAAGWKPHGEGLFMARSRHVEALRTARAHLLDAGVQSQAIELVAENLRLAQAALGTITGEVSADHLLGQIFSRFCIGK